MCKADLLYELIEDSTMICWNDLVSQKTYSYEPRAFHGVTGHIVTIFKFVENHYQVILDQFRRDKAPQQPGRVERESHTTFDILKTTSASNVWRPTLESIWEGHHVSGD